MCEGFQKLQMQGAPEDDTGSVHERTLRMAAEEQRCRWIFESLPKENAAWL
jgi:hypothetical protein